MIITGCGRLLHLLPTAVFLFKYPFQPELVTTLIIGKGNNPSVEGEFYHLSVFNGRGNIQFHGAAIIERHQPVPYPQSAYLIHRYPWQVRKKPFYCNNILFAGIIHRNAVINGKYPAPCSYQTSKVGTAAKFLAYIKGKAPYVCPFGTCDPHCNKRKHYILNMYIIYFHIPGCSFHLHPLPRKPVECHAIYFYGREHRRRLFYPPPETMDNCNYILFSYCCYILFYYNIALGIVGFCFFAKFY